MPWTRMRSLTLSYQSTYSRCSQIASAISGETGSFAICSCVAVFSSSGSSAATSRAVSRSRTAKSTSRARTPSLLEPQAQPVPKRLVQQGMVGVREVHLTLPPLQPHAHVEQIRLRLHAEAHRQRLHDAELDAAVELRLLAQLLAHFRGRDHAVVWAVRDPARHALRKVLFVRLADGGIVEVLREHARGGPLAELRQKAHVEPHGPLRAEIQPRHGRRTVVQVVEVDGVPEGEARRDVLHERDPLPGRERALDGEHGALVLHAEVAVACGEGAPLLRRYRERDRVRA